MAPSVQVFGLPVFTDVARVLTCLYEKNVEFQLIRVDSFKDDHKEHEFLKLQNLCGQVTFKERERTLTDSREICRHICEKHADEGNKRLLGTGALERSLVEQWLRAEAQNFDPPSSPLIFHLGFAPRMARMGERSDKYLIEQNRQKLDRVLGVYDDHLSNSRYLAGDEFTLADLSHLPNSHYLTTTTDVGKELFGKRKNLTRWWDDINQRQSWKHVKQLQREYPGPLEKFNVHDRRQNNNQN